MNRIAVTGSLAYDYISTYDQPFETVLLPDKLDQLSVCFLVKNKERHFGGTAGNIAYGLSLLEESPFLVAAAGYDFEDYKERLVAQKINIDYVKEYKDVASASATIITDPKGHQITEFYPGAMWAEGDIEVAKPFKEAEVIIIAPDDIRRIMQYVKIAHEVNTPYFFDPGQNLPVFTAEQLLEAIKGAEGVFLNDYELELLKDKTGLSEDEILQKAKLLIVTLGEKGSVIKDSSTALEIPIVPPSEVKDPTGCGDAYRSGFLKGYVDSKDLETCGRMGALSATYNIEQVGTQNHALTYADFMKRYEEIDW